MNKHIAIINIPAHGHVNPTLAVAKEMVQRGYRVTYVATEEFVPAIQETGATPLIYRSTIGKAKKSQSVNSAHILLQFLEEMEAVLPQLEELYRNDKPDLILYDYLAWAAKVLAIKWNIPGIQLNPTFVENEHFSMDKKFAKVSPFHPAIIRFMIKLVLFLKRQRVKELSVDRFFNYTGEKCLVFFPRVFQYAGDTFSDHFAFIGPCLSERHFQGNWQPPADNPPVLLISLGTASKVTPAFFKICVEAFAHSPWHVVMSVGKHVDPSTLGELPPNFEVHSQVPQLAILPHCTAFISHGGMNSTMEAMYHGVPLVVIPQTQEQEAIAHRVEELGIGRRLIHTEMTIESLREAVQYVANNPPVLAHVQEMQQQVHAAGGAVKAVDEITSELGKY